MLMSNILVGLNIRVKTPMAMICPIAPKAHRVKARGKCKVEYPAAIASMAVKIIIK